MRAVSLCLFVLAAVSLCLPFALVQGAPEYDTSTVSGSKTVAPDMEGRVHIGTLVEGDVIVYSWSCTYMVDFFLEEGDWETDGFVAEVDYAYNEYMGSGEYTANQERDFYLMWKNNNNHAVTVYYEFNVEYVDYLTGLCVCCCSTIFVPASMGMLGIVFWKKGERTTF